MSRIRTGLVLLSTAGMLGAAALADTWFDDAEIYDSFARNLHRVA